MRNHIKENPQNIRKNPIKPYKKTSSEEKIYIWSKREWKLFIYLKHKNKAITLLPKLLSYFFKPKQNTTYDIEKYTLKLWIIIQTIYPRSI